MNLNILYNEQKEEYQQKTTLSKESFEHAKLFLGGGETRSVSYYEPYPLCIDYGFGCEIYDVDGNKYIDCINNYTSLIHGHANPIVTKALCDAAGQGTAVPAGINDQVDLAKLLCQRIPGIERVRFCNSGTEATLFAVRAAKAYSGKLGLIKALGGYHGTTDMMEYNVSPKIDFDNPETMLVPQPDIKGVSDKIAEDMYIVPFNDLQYLEKTMMENHTKIGAMIIEPFLGAGGLIPADLDYLVNVRKLCTQYNILLVFDEVQSLRLSTGGAQKKYGVTPDLTALGKMIGGGLAVGAFGGKKEIMDIFDPTKKDHLSQSGTFNGNRASMAAGVAALNLYDEASCNRLESLAELLEQNIENSFKKHGIDGCVTRAGSLMNYHFIKEKPTNYLEGCLDNKDLLKTMHLELLNKGVFAAPRGTIALSTAMNESVIEYISNAFDTSLAAIKAHIL